MSPSLSISIIFSAIGIFPALVAIYLFKNTRPKYHGLWLIGFSLITIGAITIGVATELLQNTEIWLAKQSESSAIMDGNEAMVNLKVWAYVFPAASIALGINLITQFLLTNKTTYQNG